ncbi:hypothetical protein [Desulfoscipio geothermicus]|uniref:Uncharacterized protein n=1 Tax=Desulfoscipio geothermicus DSM 3669 TaxID=1121426 RepID=A0A1I6DLX2_9FIRM|nr:hypothetical protein [Desulfoscipio geothermicus]SFR06450.1 hypothetical protein SAMN05660706_11362 [Desulfoscipio geothermicus DSM 3669]
MRNRKLNAAEAVECLERLLGRPWLEENVKLMKDGQGGRGGFGRSIDYAALGVAPVVSLWYRAREEMIAAQISGTGLTGTHTLHAAVIGADLSSIKDCPGFDFILSRLRQANSLTPAANELCIAAGYAQSGYGVHFMHRNGFIVEGRGRKALVTCVGPAPPEDDFCMQPFQTEAGLSGTGHVLYWWAGDGFAGFGGVPAEWIALHNTSVVIFASGIQKLNNRPVFIRKGRLVSLANISLQDDIYVPGELLEPY